MSTALAGRDAALAERDAALAEQDVALAAEKVLRMSTEKAARKSLEEKAVLEAQRAINKLVDEFQLYRPGTPEQLQHWWRRLQSAKKGGGGVELPCLSYDHMMQAGLTVVNARSEL